MTFKSEQINELAGALSKFQGQVGRVLKNKTAKVFSKRTNTSFSYSYADLADILETVKKPLEANGLAVSQVFVGKSILTVLMHSSGQWIQSELELNFSGLSPQEMGSLITYMRRYAQTAILGIAADEDDDAGTAQNSGVTVAKPMPKPQVKENLPQAEVPRGVSTRPVSQTEAIELKSMLDECDDAFIANVNSYLKTLNADSFLKLPRQNFETLRKRIVNKISEMEAEVAHV